MDGTQHFGVVNVKYHELAGVFLPVPIIQKDDEVRSTPSHLVLFLALSWRLVCL